MGLEGGPRNYRNFIKPKILEPLESTQEDQADHPTLETEGTEQANVQAGESESLQETQSTSPVQAQVEA